jgi:hypothetical protein
MSARFTAALTNAAVVVVLDPDPIVQSSTVTATMTVKGSSVRPARHYVWIYDLTGTKVDVIA